ncbi:unnamed protein product [Bursaphelenchus xylophilus]|uniref:Mevalonate kinase n=1 Tax=Bursaphelenchus xylophilus TaxID=6326 RepID=A0A1I7RVY7_BURXY|nr:unnamed protein product [Bursaphelenchus xylophilus]CAG9094889.1 unnamed protein product [Bursaphelenchus xylophilus]
MGLIDPTLNEQGTMVFTAPAKTILFGEHAVVYGRLAVAGAIDLRTKVELKFRPPTATNGIDDQIEITLPDLNFTRSFPRKKFLEAAEKLALQCAQENEPEGLPPSPELAVPIAQQLCGPIVSDQSHGKHSTHPAQIAILTFLYLALGVMAKNRDIPVFKIIVTSKVPVRVGLGSSGAYCVTLAASLLRLGGLIDIPTVSSKTGVTWEENDLHMIEQWATAAESLIHGRSSGLDACVCTRGGIITYRRGEYPQPLQNTVRLRMVIVNTKVERNTLQMVRNVQDLLEKFPTVVNPIFDSIEEISKDAVKLLTGEALVTKSTSSSPLSVKKSDTASLMDVACNGNGTNGTNGVVEQLANGIDSLKAGFTENGFENLQELCRINNHLLNALGVGHAKITQISSLLARYGIHTKLSGAGGGGTVFAFITKDASPTLLEMIETELRKQGFDLWQPDLGGVGVQQQS